MCTIDHLSRLLGSSHRGSFYQVIIEGYVYKYTHSPIVGGTPLMKTGLVTLRHHGSKQQPQ